MKKILITGGSGLLALNWALEERNRVSIVLGMHEKCVFLAGVESRKIDLNSVGKLIQDLEVVSPKLVIHAAGLTSVEQCEREPKLANYINVTLASNVAKACYFLGIKLVYISSDHLSRGTIPYITEDFVADPINVYAATKANGELAVLENHPDAIVVRTNFYGWGTTYRKSFTDKIIDALRLQDSVELFQDVYFTPISVACLAEAISQLLLQNESGIFNVVGDDRISKFQFGLSVADVFGLDSSRISPVVFADNTKLVRRPHDMSLSNKKVVGLIGRRLGGVREHLVKLYHQELDGLAQELRKL